MDRNFDAVQIVVVIVQSLSARRAWIEIIMQIKTVTGCVVALRKESVDRNVSVDVAMVPAEQSLSARRAWIEIALL